MIGRLLVYIGIGVYLFHISNIDIKGTIPVQVVNETLPIQIVDTPIPIKTDNVTSTDIIPEDVMPISEYKRPYEIEKVGLIWRAMDGPSYIDSEHKVVQWFTRNTEINNENLYYKNTYIRVVPKYYSDSKYINKDYWQNADYYLSHGLSGDCEDYAIAMASILEAKGIPNMIIGGLTSSINDKHLLLEYYIDGKYYITDTYYGLYIPREYIPEEDWVPIMMFNKTVDYSIYDENWYTIERYRKYF